MITIGYIAIIKGALKALRKKVANKLVEIAIGKSRWAHLVDPSDRRDDLAHQDVWNRIVRRGVDDFGLTRKQSQELFSKSLKMKPEERFDDVNDIIKDEGLYDS